MSKFKVGDTIYNRTWDSNRVILNIKNDVYTLSSTNDTLFIVDKEYVYTWYELTVQHGSNNNKVVDMSPWAATIDLIDKIKKQDESIILECKKPGYNAIVNICYHEETMLYIGLVKTETICRKCGVTIENL